MSIDLHNIPKRLTEAAKNGTLVPFIGAGLSQQAKTKDASAFPTWSQLIKTLGQKAVSKGYVSKTEAKQIQALVSQHKFLMAAQALKSELPADEFASFIEKRFKPEDAKPGLVHKSLFKLRCPLIITTNYDTLLEDAFASEFGKSATTLTFKNAPDVQRLLQSHRPWADRPFIFKIHGSVTNPADAVLGEIDYRNLIYRQPGYRTVLSAVFVTKVVLMLGFSFTDPELSLLLETLRESLKYGSSPDYIVLPKGKKSSVEKKRLRDDFGLEVIEYTPSPGHPEVRQLIEYLSKFAPKRR